MPHLNYKNKLKMDNIMVQICQIEVSGIVVFLN